MKVYKYIKTGSSAISITANKNKFVKVPVAPEGAVSKFVVRQASGSNVAYEVDLFDTAILVEGEHTTSLPADVEMYRVFPLKTALSGATISEYTTGEVGYSYRNMDGSFTAPVRCLWLHIRPTSAGGTTTWDVCIVVVNEVP